MAVNTQSSTSPVNSQVLMSAGGAAALGGTVMLAMWWRRHGRTVKASKSELVVAEGIDD